MDIEDIKSISVIECMQCGKIVMLGEKEHDTIIFNGILSCPHCSRGIKISINGEEYTPPEYNYYMPIDLKGYGEK